MQPNTTIYDCDGMPLESGAILESFGAMYLEPEAQFLATAPLWRVEVDAINGWRIQPQRGGDFHLLTQDVAEQCRYWPSPVTDICDPTGRMFPKGTPEEHKFFAV